MSKINKLPKNIYELIAAGEVVERPASVVKELMENSIDAGATDITLEIQNGGIKYIRITDNGCGIDREDVPLAFTSHATSKISKEADLYTIGTLGFRGEALASIAAVSHTELLSRTADSEIGARMEVNGGEASQIYDAGCPVGTTIIIRDLFYNTPARMKFLKTDRAEGTAVAGIIDKIALSHPEISIRFIKDGKQQICTSGNGNLKLAIFSVFGKEFSETLLPISYTFNNISVNGFISKPFNSRGSNSMQLFFVNNRYIKSRTASAALNESYKNSIMTGKYPACVIFITVMPESVDVNVHPAKTEVRFSSEKDIFDAVYYASKNALNVDTSHPQVHFDKRNIIAAPIKEIIQEKFVESKEPELFDSYKSFGFPHKNILRDSSESEYKAVNDELPDLSYKNTAAVNKKIDIEFEEEAPLTNQSDFEAKTLIIAAKSEEQKPVKVLGEAFKTYIFAEFDGKLIIIDKHAAHERMLFNKLKKSNGDSGSQMLLSPLNVTLSKEEYAAVIENIDLIKDTGFDIEDFGKGSVIVRACPLNLEKEDLTALVTEIAGYLIKNQKDILPEKLDWIYHSMACRAAIKAGNITSQYEVVKFTEELLNSTDVKYCPHGRPVIIEMTKYEIDKKFGRIQ